MAEGKSQETPFDDVLRSIAEGDQAQASLTAFAQMMFNYRADLLAAGFSKVEALHLVGHYQNTLVSGMMNRNPPGGASD